jgi:uncharacterized protein (DUF1015 family)
VPRPEGLVLSPFRALRFDPAVAGDLADVTSPPYDVLDDGAVADLEARSDSNVVRLILPRDTPDGADRYTRAASLLERWRADGVLRPDPEPALYVYEQSDPRSGHVQRGLLGALGLSPAEDGIVLPHESTMAGPVADRLALYTAVGADLEPIFLVYDGGGAASRAVAAVDLAVPLVDAVLGDGLRHRLWAITEPSLLQHIADDLRPRKALIADGHHRYATYLQRQADHHAAGDGPGPWTPGCACWWTPRPSAPRCTRSTGSCPASPSVGWRSCRQQVLRCDGSKARWTRRSPRSPRPAARVRPSCSPRAATSRTPSATSSTSSTRLSATPQFPPTARRPGGRWTSTVLHVFLVPVLWGLPDDEGTVGFEHDVASALRSAAATAGTAVLLGPTPVEAVAAVAAQGERMPRKSTLFTPKPRTGVVLRDHKDA